MGDQATLLVVDDEPEIHKLVASKKPDLVILDLNLPKIDGWEVCRRLKSAPATKSIPIIMLTAAHANVDDAQIGLGLGADEYVAKPFVRAVLLHNVERLLGREPTEETNPGE